MSLPLTTRMNASAPPPFSLLIPVTSNPLPLLFLFHVLLYFMYNVFNTLQHVLLPKIYNLSIVFINYFPPPQPWNVNLHEIRKRFIR